MAYVTEPALIERVPSIEDYTKLGITGIGSDALLAVLNDALSTDPSLSGLLSDAELLQALVDDFNASMELIRLYSEAPLSNEEPDFEVYQKLRLSDIDASLVSAVNSVLADRDVVLLATDVRNEIHTLITTYKNLLAYASGDAEAMVPLRADYDLLGVTQLVSHVRLIL